MNLELRFGQPNSYDFETILDQFSGMKINSFRTSSIPLVQFWKQTDDRLNELLSRIELKCDKPVLCFEYPTKPRKGKGKSSMTDLMILGENFKIAIEAKFTEYAKSEQQLIDNWKCDGDKENRLNVLDYWTSLIKPFSNGYDDDSLKNISYQFYHRTASACKTEGKAIVVYLLFYDSETYDYLERYKNKLQKYIEILNPNDNLSFYIWEVEVNQIVKESKENNDINPFIEMKSQDIYKFKKTNLEKVK